MRKIESTIKAIIGSPSKAKHFLKLVASALNFSFTTVLLSHVAVKMEIRPYAKNTFFQSPVKVTINATMSGPSKELIAFTNCEILKRLGYSPSDTTSLNSGLEDT